MQAYRDMDIGTAKPSADVRERLDYRMIDIADPEDTLTVREFQDIGRAALDDVDRAGGRIVICGGSGLHFRALVDPMTFAPTDPRLRAELEAAGADATRSALLDADPEAGAHVDLDNPRRVVRAVEVLRLTGETPTARAASPEGAALASYEPIRPFVGIGLDPGPGIGARVVDRFDRMLSDGLLAEVRSLADRLGPTASQAVGYKELIPVVAGRISLSSGRDAAVRATNGLVKRQRTYFRRDPRVAWQPWQDEEARRIDAVLDVIEERTAWTS